MAEEALVEVLGARIKSARKAMRLSQEELGDRIGLDQSTVSKIERSDQTTDVVTLYRFARVLRRSIPWLLGLPSDLSDNEQELIHCYRHTRPLSLGYTLSPRTYGVRLIP